MASNGQVDLTLLSNFVHQVINPLNGIIGTVDNIIDGTVPPDKRQQRLVAVRAQLEHSVMLVRNLAYFAQMSYSKEAFRESFGSKISVIPQVAIEALLFYQEEGNKHNLKIHYHDRMIQYAVNGPPELLRQVFMNLVDNAIKYSLDGTSIDIKPVVSRKYNELFVEFVNVGIGFSNDVAVDLFKLGYRSEDAKKKIASGTGLGLFICKEIIEGVFGGTIEANHSNKLGETMFRVRLPNFTVRD